MLNRCNLQLHLSSSLDKKQSNMDVKMQKNTSTIAYFFLIFISITCLLTTIAVSASDSDYTLKHLTQFRENTKTIVADTLTLIPKMEPQFQEISDILDETQSAKAVLSSGVVNQIRPTLAQLMNLAKQYVAHYQTFQNQLTPQSSCYQPENVAQFKDIIARTQAAADLIPSLQMVTDERQAFEAVSALMMIQTSANIMVTYFESFKLCYLADASVPMMDKFNQLSQLMEQQAILAKNTGKVPEWLDQAAEQFSDGEWEDEDENELPELDEWQEPTDSIAKSVRKTVQVQQHMLPDMIELIEYTIDDYNQLEQLNLTNGLSFNERYELVLPIKYQRDLSLEYRSRIIGVLQYRDGDITLDIELIREPRT